MVKFLHTADWQIGMRAERAGEAGTRVRQERFRAAERVIEAARISGAEFLLVAGDTFEHNAVERVSVQAVGDILARFGRPVYIIPGNHDPLSPGSVWEHPVWRAPNLHVLREAAPVDAVGAEIFPCPLQEAHGRRDPTAWIPAAADGRIRIGLAHGSVQGLPQADPDFPVARDAAERAGLDYLALGHWHSHAEFGRMAYSGSHEQTKFGERASGYALAVEIAGPGAAPAIEPVRTGGLDWVEMARELHSPGEIQRALADVEAIASPGSALVSVRLTGLMFADDLGPLAQLRDILGSRFLFGELEAAGLRPAPEDAAWIDAIPAGILREAAVRLRDWADPASSDVAANALLELYALAREERA